MYRPKVIDLCCGAGGFSEGFRQAGFEIVLGVDNWSIALESFRANQKCDILEADILNLRYDSLPDCDVLIGSPPCPEFSVAKQIVQRTFDLKEVRAFLKLVEHLQPKYWIMENTPELGKHLSLPYQTLKACGYGLRQRRRRAFFGTIPVDLRTSCNGHKHIPTVCATEYKGCSSKSKIHKLNRFSDFLGRRAQIEECKKEMGFPDQYIFYGNKQDQYIQIGNAVVPPVAYAIAKSIRIDYGRKKINHNPSSWEESDVPT